MPNSNSAVVRPHLTRRRETNDSVRNPSSATLTAAEPAARIATRRRGGHAALFESLESRTHLSVSKDAAGFTVVTPGSGSRVIHVAPNGNDSNPGTTDRPIRSVSKGVSLLRNGTGDQLLFQRGGQYAGGLGYLVKSGRSSSEPLVIGAYGSGSRPVLNTGGSYALSSGGGGGLNNLVVQGIKFASNGTAVADGIAISGRASNLLFEDVEITRYVNNIVLQKFFGPITNVTIRRSVITDAFSRSGRNAEGMFAEAVNGLVLEDNVFDHNGWGNGKGPTPFNHGAYIRSTTTGFVARGNIFSNSSSHGLQARGGGVIENNVFLNNAVHLSFGLVNGSPVTPGGVSGRVTNNVMMGTRNINSLIRGVGLEVGNVRRGGTTISGNIVANGNPSAKLPAIQLAVGSNNDNFSQAVGINDLTLSNNVIYNWSVGFWVVAGQAPGGGPRALNNLKVVNNHIQKIATPMAIMKSSPYGTYANNLYTTASYNKYFSNAGGSNVQVNYADASRTPGKLVGGSNDTFVSLARRQAKGNWNTKYTAAAAVAYVKQGFSATGTLALRR